MSDKKLKQLVYACAIFFLAALVYFFLGGTDDSIPAETATSTPIIATSTPVVRMESFTYATSSINLVVEYVQFVRFSSSTVESMINSNLKKEAKKIYDEQLQELKQSVTPDSFLIQSGGEVMFQRKVSKENIYINSETGIISIPYTNYVDTGGAHGTFFYTAQTLDSSTGKKIILADLLEKEYEDISLAEIKRQIMIGEDTESCVHCSSGLSEQEGIPVFVSENFVLTEKGVSFLYSAYDLGAYAITSSGQEITVTRGVFEDLVKRVW